MTSVVMGVLEGRQGRKRMSGNSIIIFRGLDMANCHACDKGAFCCCVTVQLGREETNASVSGSFDLKQRLYMHVNICGLAAWIFF